jgi:hypothetical protein
MLSFTKKEITFLRRLNTPPKVQDFLNSLQFNFERDGIDVLKSPIRVLRERNAHCIEGALLGAFVLSLHGHKPLVLHLETGKGDFDHVVTLFKIKGLWGALSKTNHGVLRYREPIYRNIHKLVMSYFHEYFLDNGLKTLRKYSRPLNLNFFGKKWMLQEKDLWQIDKKLDEVKHFWIAPLSVFKKLRKAEKIEIKMGKIEEYRSKR